MASGGFSRKMARKTVITPHAKELADMLNVSGKDITVDDIRKSPEHYAELAYNRTGAVCLLKGAKTVIASFHDTVTLPSSTNWLAQAGSGDVLTGILAGVLAQNIESVQSESRAIAQYAALAHTMHSVSAALCNQNGPVPAYNIAQMIPQAVSLYVADKDKFFTLAGL
jgi:NAD(P)H-hydrate repair Nnr-like enzyme with NAD(P)H-hydrate dehydratase domain